MFSSQPHNMKHPRYCRNHGKKRMEIPHWHHRMGVFNVRGMGFKGCERSGIKRPYLGPYNGDVQYIVTGIGL